MRKLGIKIGLLALMTLIVMAVSYAADTFEVPTVADILAGSVTLNISTDLNDNATNCTVTIVSTVSGSASIDVVLVNTTTNGTFNYATLAWDTRAVVDATDYSFTASCVNTSDVEVATPSRTGITIDNTNPVCTHLQTANTAYPPTQTFAVTCTNATSATIQFGTNRIKDMAELNDVCTFTGAASTLPEGIYTVTVVTSDGTDTTQCTLAGVEIDVDSTLKQVGIAAAASSAAAKKGAGLGSNGNMAFLVIIGGAAIWYARKKK